MLNVIFVSAHNILFFHRFIDNEVPIDPGAPYRGFL